VEYFLDYLQLVLFRLGFRPDLRITGKGQYVGLSINAAGNTRDALYPPDGRGSRDGELDRYVMRCYVPQRKI